MNLTFTDRRTAGIEAAKAENEEYAEKTNEEYVQFVMDGAADTYCLMYGLPVEGE